MCVWEGGGGAPYNGLYGEAPPKRGTLFEALGIWKGRNFTSLSSLKGSEIRQFNQSVKEPKRANRRILLLWKFKKTSWFSTAVNRDAAL